MTFSMVRIEDLTSNQPITLGMKGNENEITGVLLSVAQPWRTNVGREKAKVGLIDYLIGWRKLGINRGDLVLEVGSGGRPFARSDILVDMFLDDNTERGSVKLTHDRPLICANAEKLPFESASFDFVLTSHMLEHLIYPERFLDEVRRVGCRGFIITPSEFCEKVLPSHRHLWLISIDEEGTLVLKQKSQVSEAGLPSILHDVWLTDRRFRKFITDHTDLFETRFSWDGPFNYQVLRQGSDRPSWFHKATMESEESEYSYEKKSNQDSKLTSIKRFVRSLLSRFVRRFHTGTAWVDVASFLVCPSCHAKLVFADNSVIICSSCSHEYLVRDDGVPILLSDQ